MSEELIIIVTGPVGSGKTTTAWSVQDELEKHEIPNALADMDYLRAVWPRVSRFNAEMGFKNLAAIVPNYAVLGVRVYVIADVVEDASKPSGYQQALPGAREFVVRLHVSKDELHKRLRHRESEESLQWYLNRANELTEIMEANNVGDLVVDVGDKTSEEVAKEIVDHLLQTGTLRT